MGRYDALWRYIQVNCSDGDVITFEKAEEIADVTIDSTFSNYKAEIIPYGFRIDWIAKKEKYFVVKTL